MKRTGLFLVIAIGLLWSCSKAGNSQIIPTQTDTLFKQFGTPFAGIPNREDVVIYQVNIRAFSSGGNFAGVTARLDSIKAMGANVIYLMPTYPIGQIKSVNSPYCIKDYFGVNPEFGNLGELRQLVAEAHNRNMTVLLDWVANHTAWDNAWTTNHKDWYLQDGAGNIISPPNTGWNDVAQLNFNNRALRNEMIKAMKYWVYQANIDGYRCDYADGPPVDFWTEAIDSLRKITSHKLLLLSEGKRPSHFSIGFDYNFGFGFFETLEAVYKNNRPALGLDDLQAAENTGANATQRVVRYTTNHDVNGSNGTPEELYGGQSGALSAFVSAAFCRSVPMLYGGQEVGTPYRLVFPFTARNIDWSLNPLLKEEYKKLIALYNNHATLRIGSLQTYSTADVVAYGRTSGTDQWLIIANPRNREVTYTLPAVLQNKRWRNHQTGNLVNIATIITLHPYGYSLLQQE